MKERGILFSAPMVRALLDGSKTQTRRVVKPTRGRPIEFLGGGPRGGADWNNPECWGYETGEGDWVLLRADRDTFQYPCPCGRPGDRLWVRETWSHDAASAEQCRASHEDLMGSSEYGPYYRATESAPDTLRWIPAIHMFRWASRITLEITSVRVERLQDISEADAIAEGIEERVFGSDPCRWRVYGVPDTFTSCPVTSYQSLWEFINGAGSWETNPWAWVVEFRRLPS